MRDRFLNFRNPSLRLNQILGGTIKSLPCDLYAIGMLNATNNLVDNRVLLVPHIIYEPMEITGVGWFQGTQGNYVSDGFNGVAAFSTDGTNLTRIAISTDDGDIWKASTNSYNQKAFTSPIILQPGLYYASALYCNSSQTTAPSLYANTSISVVNTVNYANSAKGNCYVSGQTSISSSYAFTGTTGNAVILSLCFY